jgi:hypothetical protein
MIHASLLLQNSAESAGNVFSSCHCSVLVESGKQKYSLACRPEECRRQPVGNEKSARAVLWLWILVHYVSMSW